MQIQIQESRFERYAKELETTKVKQIRGSFFDHQGRSCAYGVLIRKFGNDIHKDCETLGKIISLNDHELLSFKEIAEWLRHQ